MTIQELTIYRTEDGSEFRTREAASAYVGRFLRVKLALQELPEYSFVSGEHGYIQHDYDVAHRALNALLDLIEEKTGAHRWITDTRTKGPKEAHPSWVGRLLGDYDDTALNRAWGRMQRINWQTMREYSQTYYADHPDEAKGGCLNSPAKASE